MTEKNVPVNKDPANTNQKISLFWLSILLKLIFTSITGVGLLYIGRLEAIGGMLVWVIWFLILWLIASPWPLKIPMVWDKILRVCAKSSALILAMILVISVTLVVSFESDQLKPEKLSPSVGEFLKSIKLKYHYSDGPALVEQAANNLLDGKNPYTAANVVTAMKEYNGLYQTLTPLREGRFADLFLSPSLDQLQQIWKESLTTPQTVPAELESRLGYPAGSFLLLIPFVFSGIDNLHWICLFFLVATIVFSVFYLPQKSRWIFLLATIFSIELWYSCFVGADKRMLIFPFLLIGWLMITRKPILATILLGIAAASYQIAWFIIPFALILLYRYWGLKQALWGLTIVTLVFLIFNLPFMIIDYKVWQMSVMAPMADKLFPLGVGLVSLVISGIINPNSVILFTSLEIAVLIGGIIWYFMNARKYPNCGILLSVLPLFFAWRSNTFYFYYIDIIVFVAFLAQNTVSSKVTA